MIYLFIGEDELTKQEKLKDLKAEFLNPASVDFNYELLYAKEIELNSLQEIFSRLPVNSQKRVVVVKDAVRLSEKVKEFLVQYAKKPYPHIILVLDVLHRDTKDQFLKAITPHAKLVSFQEAVHTNTFKLCDDLERKSITLALKTLHQLLGEGEKPERILGGLRYRWERDYGLNPKEKTRRFSLLLNCDIDIKRGRLKPEFSLEKLCINLCCF